MKHIDTICKVIAKKLPKLPYKLKQANIREKPELFIKKVLFSSFYATALIAAVLFVLLIKSRAFFLLAFAAPVLYALVAFYLFKIPDGYIRREERAINREIIFAMRFLIIELESGIPLYNALANAAANYEVVGRYLKTVIDKVNLGTSIEDALNETVEVVPSNDFRRMLWQLINSLKTGTNVGNALGSVADQVAREQKIEMERYGRRLNPIAMFYMIIAVILPSLGITLLIILSTFIKFELSLAILLVVAFLLAFVQFMFLSIIKFSRPAVEL